MLENNKTSIKASVMTKLSKVQHGETISDNHHLTTQIQPESIVI